MVTARELSLRQVAEITEYIAQNDIRGPKGELVEIEVFAHGALCMAVSGKCYLSLDNYNHSANRGECLQLCRRQYKVSDLESDIELVVDNKYIMSPKDLCTLPFIDKVLKAGVRVLKIEGRGRSAEYVKTVTRCYKEAAQAVADGTFSKEKIENWMERLKTVYNRGFWDGYYLGRTMGEWTERYGSQATQTKIYVGKITNYFANINVAEIKMESGDMQLGDKIMIMGPTTGVYEDTLSEIRVDLKPVPQTAKGDMCSIPTSEVVRRGDKVYKVVTSIDEF
jgi:putative protease